MTETPFPWNPFGPMPDSVRHLFVPSDKEIAYMRRDGRWDKPIPKQDSHIVIHKNDVKSAAKRKVSI